MTITATSCAAATGAGRYGFQYAMPPDTDQCAIAGEKTIDSKRIKRRCAEDGDKPAANADGPSY